MARLACELVHLDPPDHRQLETSRSRVRHVELGNLILVRVLTLNLTFVRIPNPEAVAALPLPLPSR